MFPAQTENLRKHLVLGGKRGNERIWRRKKKSEKIRLTKRKQKRCPEEEAVRALCNMGGGGASQTIFRKSGTMGRKTAGKGLHRNEKRPQTHVEITSNWGNSIIVMNTERTEKNKPSASQK